jgi:tetratricopeptide (TPR) repeat protein
VAPTEPAPVNPFEVLEVPYDAGDRPVRQAYSRKLREARAAGDAEAERSIQTAFEAIRDELPRRQLAQILRNEAHVHPLLRSARAALEAGDIESARRSLSRVLEALPDCLPATWMLVEAARASGDLDGCIRHLEAIESLDRQQRAVPYQLAQALLFKGSLLSASDPAAGRPFLERSLEAVGRARRLGAPELDCVLAETDVLRRLDRMKETRDILERFTAGLTQVGAADVEAFRRLLLCQASERDDRALETTISRLGSILPEDPERKRALAAALEAVTLGLLRLENGKAGMCADLVESCLAGDAPATGEGGGLDDSPGRIFRRRFELEARIMPHLLAFDAALRGQDVDTAGTLLGKVLEVDPDRSGAIGAFADFAMKNGETERAVQALEKLVHAAPLDPTAWHRLAWALLKKFSGSGSREAGEPSLARAGEAIERLRALGVPLEATILLESQLRRYRGLLEEDRGVLRSFVQDLKRLDEESLEVVAWTLQCLALDDKHRQFQLVLARLREIMPGTPPERAEVGRVLKLAAAQLRNSPAFAIPCAELALECLPDDAELGRLIDLRTRAAPPDVPAERGSIWSKVAGFIAVMFLIRACVGIGAQSRRESRPPSSSPPTSYEAFPGNHGGRAFLPGQGGGNPRAPIVPGGWREQVPAGGGISLPGMKPDGPRGRVEGAAPRTPSSLPTLPQPADPTRNQRRGAATGPGMKHPGGVPP